MCTLLKNIGSLATPIGLGKPYEVKVIENSAILIKDEKILFVGPEREMPPANVDKVYNGEGRLATPGFIDCHTHPMFTSHRADEFYLRNSGISYTEISARGGGIRASVRALRKASQEYLQALLSQRFDGFLALGTTTIEAKSGYGLSLEDEIKSLRAIAELKDHPLEVVPTFLGAHEIPDEYRSQRESYIRLLIEEMIPAVAKENLAEYCDIFVEKGVYSTEEARVILLSAQKAGLKVRLHADQLTPGKSAQLASELKAVSADHLEHIDQEGIERMVEAGVIFTLLPGSIFFLGHRQYPPAREIIQKGGTIALASDFNPGSSMTRSLPLMMTLACIYMGLSWEEALTAVTLNAAKALNRHNRLGSLEAGKQADIILWDAPSAHYLPYHFGENLVCAVFKRGNLVFKKSECSSENDHD